MCAEPPKPDLHFVRNADSACGAHMAIRLGQIVLRENNLSGDTRQGFRKKSDAAIFLAKFLGDFPDMRGVFRTKILFTAAIEAAIIVRNRRDVYPVLLPAAARTVEFVRAYVDQRVRVAVISVFENYDVVRARFRPRHSNRQFIRFASRIYEIAAV